MGVSSSTKFRLYALSGNKCAWKDCNQLLTNEENVNSKISTYQVGKVAHIRAQSKGGPRYDPDYPEDKIQDIDNLILLCGNCHDRIDTLPKNHVVETLLEMKRKHEDKIKTDEIPKIHFAELSTACSALASNTYDKTRIDWEYLEIDQKINKNKLSTEVENLLTHGLSRSHEVENFLSQQSKIDPNYPERLKKGFKDQYNLLSKNYSSDDLFYKMKYWAENIDYNYEGNIVAVQAAGFVVLCHLFHICEVFEK